MAKVRVASEAGLDLKVAAGTCTLCKHGDRKLDNQNRTCTQCITGANNFKPLGKRKLKAKGLGGN